MNADYNMMILKKYWLIPFIILILCIVGCVSENADRPDGDYDVLISDGKILEYTLKLLQMWKVDDEKGIKRIQILDPPEKESFRNDIEWFNAIRLWMRKTSQHGPAAFNHPLYPPLMIEKIRGDVTYSATCGPFSVAYSGLLLSYDIPVRLVHIYAQSDKKGLVSHTFAEVWSEDFQKWVVQDVDLNICWINNQDILMNAREIQEELASGKDRDQWNIVPKRDISNNERIDSIDKDIFYRLVIAFQSNYFHAGNVPYLSYQRGSLFHLIRNAESEKKDSAWEIYKNKLLIKTVNNPTKLYAPMNQISIIMIETKDEHIFTLNNNILNFDHYEICEGSEAWNTHKGNKFIQKKKDIRETKVIMFRGVSKHNHLTKPAIIRFNVATL